MEELVIRPSMKFIKIGYGVVIVLLLAAVIAQSFLGLLEMSSENVGERLNRGENIRVERIQIINRDQTRLHVPFVVANHLVGRLYIGRRNVPVRGGVALTQEPC